jgi:hypothetical protein
MHLQAIARLHAQVLPVPHGTEKDLILGDNCAAFYGIG